MHALLASLPLIGLPDQVTSRLAWVLVHFVWQGAAIAGLLALTLWLGRVKRPAVRYACGLVALAVMVACPVITFGLVRPARDAAVTASLDQAKVAIIAPRDEPFASGRSITAGSSRGAMMATLKGASPRDSLEFEADLFGSENLEPHSRPAHATDFTVEQADAPIEPFARDATRVRTSWSRVQPWIVSGWLVGVAAFSIRLLLGWFGVWRLRRRVEPVPEWLAERVRSLSQALRVTRPLIHLSQRVTEAVAVGFLKPMILLPVAWVTELQPDMIEAVIAHELAHIRRGDLWVNLLQRLVETLLFYHPAVWWLSRRLRIDRELCCDELVVRTLHNPLRYAETLEHIGRLSLANTDHSARRNLTSRSLPTPSTLTVSIGSPRNILLTRIRAILTPPPQDRSTTAWLAGLIPLTLACLIGWSLASRQLTPANAEPRDAASPSTNAAASEGPDRTDPLAQADQPVVVGAAASAAEAVVTTEAAGTVETFLDEPTLTYRRRTRAALDEQTETLFTETPLGDALRYLEDLHAIKIVIDEAVQTDLANRDQVTLNLQGEELRFALSQILSPLGLTYMFAADHLLVTTPDEVRRRGGTPPDDGAALLKRLKEKYPSVRWYELRRGEPLLPDDLSTMREVLNGLSDADPAIQVEACRVIRHFKDSAKEAVPRLEKLTQHTDIVLRRVAYRALAEIGQDDFSTLPIILAGMVREDEATDGSISRLFAGTGDSESFRLEEPYRNGSDKLRRRLLRELMLEPTPRPTLVRLGLAETNPDLRRIALRILVNSHSIPEYADILRPFLTSTMREERSIAAQMLTQVAADMETALTILIDDAFAEGTENERRRAFSALYFLRGDSVRQRAAKQLKERMETDLKARWFDAATFVIQLTPHDATDVIEKLARHIRENALDAAEAADVLVAGHKSSECESVLTKLLAEVSVETRLNLARAVIPAPDRATRLPLHLRLLDDPDPSVVRQTIESMLRDSVAAPALPKLRQLAESGPDAIRAAARHAVDSLTPPQPPPLKPREARSNKWGTAARDGVRTQIALRTSDHAVGKPVIVTLFVKNESERARVVSQGQAWDPKAFEIIGPDGKVVPSMSDSWHPDDTGEEIEPGEVWSLAEAGLDWAYLLEHPGRYSIRFVGRDDKPKEHMFGENRVICIPPNATLLPPSNTLTIELAPGTLTDRTAAFVRLRPITPAGWTFLAFSTGDFLFQPPTDTPAKSLPALWLWFSKESSPARATPKPGEPPVERLGHTQLGHAFLTLPPETKAAWPHCVEAIRAQLPAEVKEPLGPDQREMRIKPRGGKNATFTVSNWRNQSVVPPFQVTLLEGGVEIEVVEGNGTRLRLQADKATLTSAVDAEVMGFSNSVRSPASSLLKLDLTGKVTLEYVRQPEAKPITLTAERMQIDLAKHAVTAEKVSFVGRDGTSATIDRDVFVLPVGPEPERTFPKVKPDEKQKPEEGDLRSEPRRGQETRAEPKPGQTGHGVVLSVRGRVRIDGPIPVVPPLKIKPTFRAIIPRNREEDLRNEEREQAAPVIEIPDDSLVLSKEGGVANVAIYLKKAPNNWKPSAPPTDPIVIEAIEHRFSPHMAFIRTGQSLTVKNSMSEATNFHSHPIHASGQNVMANFRDERLIKSPYSQSEPLPNQFVSDVHPWMKGYLIALDHPFAAITDADGRFEIRDLPPGEHHFTVWHERRGYLNKDLVVRVEDGKVSEVDLKFTEEPLARRDDLQTPPKRNAAAPSAASPIVVDAAKQRASRLKANDPAAAKVVGRWMLTLPAGFVFEAEATLTDDGCVKLGGKKGNNLFGKFAVRGDRLELVEPTDKGIVDLVWQVKSNNRLTLIVDQNNVGAKYLGATLERIAAP